MPVNNSNPHPSLKRRLRRHVSAIATVMATAAVPATLVVLATQPGCFLFGSPGPSSVGQGHKYVSGNPEYDQYFSQLYELQVEMGKAPDTEKAIRKKLAKKLGIDADASAALLAHKVKKNAEKIAKRGVGLQITLEGGDDNDGAGSAKLQSSGGTLSGDAKKFANAVEDAVVHEQKLAAEMKKSHKLLDQLRAKTVELKANVESVFRKGGIRKQAEVKKNLKDADTMITLMVARSDDVSDAASKTIKRLAEAIHTDHGQFKAAAEEGAEKKEPEKKKPHWHPPPHRGAAPPATHKPPPPKKPASPPPSDFEP